MSMPLDITTCHVAYDLVKGQQKCQKIDHFPLATCTDLIGGVFDRAMSAGAEAYSQSGAVTTVLHPVLQELLLRRGGRP